MLFACLWVSVLACHCLATLTLKEWQSEDISFENSLESNSFNTVARPNDVPGVSFSGSNKRLKRMPTHPHLVLDLDGTLISCISSGFPEAHVKHPNGSVRQSYADRFVRLDLPGSFEAVLARNITDLLQWVFEKF